MRPRIAVTADLQCLDDPPRLEIRLGDAYVGLVEEAGGLPVLVPPLARFADDIAEGYRVQGLLLTGGRDLDPAFYGRPRHPRTDLLAPRRQEAELGWFRWADRAGIPILGICLGCQVINVARGGTLHQYLPDLPGTANHGTAARPSAHDVMTRPGHLRKAGGNRLTGISSSHRQAADALGAGLIVTGVADDGVVEAIEDPARPFLVGVQWHPERTPDHPATRALVHAFVAACRTVRE